MKNRYQQSKILTVILFALIVASCKSDEPDVAMNKDTESVEAKNSGMVLEINENADVKLVK